MNEYKKRLMHSLLMLFMGAALGSPYFLIADDELGDEEIPLYTDDELENPFVQEEITGKPAIDPAAAKKSRDQKESDVPKEEKKEEKLVSSSVPTNFYDLKKFLIQLAADAKSAKTLGDKKKAVLNMNNFQTALISVGSRLPKGSISLFENLTLSLPEIVEIPEGFNVKLPAGTEPKGGFGLKGKMSYANQEVTGTAWIIQINDAGAYRASFTFDLPKGVSFIDLPFLKTMNIPGINQLRKLTIPQVKIIASDFEYKDPEYAIEVKRGLNIIGTTVVDGVFGPIKDLIAALNLTMLKQDTGPAKAKFQAVIAPVIADSSIKAVVPLGLGFDFQELYQDGKLPFSLDPIKRAIIGSVDIAIVLSSSDMKFAVSCPLKFLFKNQDKPFQVVAAVDMGVTEAVIKGYLKDGEVIDPFIAKWLSLESIGIDFAYNYKTIFKLWASGVPAPFTGLGIQGGLGLGTKNNRSVVSMGGQIKLDDKAGSLILFGDLQKAKDATGNKVAVNLTQLVQWLVKTAGVSIPSLDTLPTIAIPRGYLYLATQKGDIAGREFKKGMGIDGEIKIGAFEGGLKAYLSPEDDILTAQGHMAPLDLGFIKFDGVGTQGAYAQKFKKETAAPDAKSDTDTKSSEPEKTATTAAAEAPKLFKGPELDVHVVVENGQKFTQESYIKMKGQVAIPALKLSSLVDFDLSNKGMKGSFSASMGSLFTGSFDISFDPKDLQSTLVQFAFKQDFVTALIGELQKLAKAEAIQIDQSLQLINMALLAEKKSSAYADQVKIDKLVKERDEWAQKCKGPAALQLYKEACRNQTQLDIEILAIRGKRAVVGGVLEGAAAAYQAVRSLEAKTSLALKMQKACLSLVDSLSQALAKSAQLIQIHGIKGEVRAQDLIAKKTPLLAFDVTINGKRYSKTLQFDFANSASSLKSLAASLFKDMLANALK